VETTKAPTSDSTGCYTWFVWWRGKQKSSAIRTYFGKATTNAVCTQVYEMVDEENPKKEYGSRSRQGKAVSQTPMKTPTTVSDADAQLEDRRCAFEMMLVAFPFYDIIRLHNCMYGLNLAVEEYALFYFHTIDQQALLLVIAKSIMKKIDEVSTVFKSKGSENDVDELLKLLRERPHIFYRQNKNPISDAMNTFSGKQLREMNAALRYGRKTEIEIGGDSTVKRIMRKAGRESELETKTVIELALTPDAVLGSVMNSWVRIEDLTKEEKEERNKLEQKRKEEEAIPKTYRNSTSMIKQLASAILEKELQYPTTKADLTPEKMIEAVRNCEPPKAELRTLFRN
jgi:hypothetical protein